MWRKKVRLLKSYYDEESFSLPLVSRWAGSPIYCFNRASASFTDMEGSERGKLSDSDSYAGIFFTDVNSNRAWKEGASLLIVNETNPEMGKTAFSVK